MRILSIETSCDDTGVAILEALPAGRQVKANKLKTLANVVSSQQIHQNYGGVFPMMAKREHQANLVPALTQALALAKLANSKSKTLNPKQIQNLKKILEKENTLFESVKEFLEKYEKPFDYAQGKPAIDAIAVTYGPGLEPCLWVGVNFAKALSYAWNVPIIPVNHIEAHILVNFMKPETWNMKQTFPAISLVVSGGHTQLILVKKIGSYKIIGETRDDAAGECFDKCAKLLGLEYPGGPEIARIAAQFQPSTKHIKNVLGALALPRPMMHSKDYDFSFSGLKTAVLYETRGKKLTKQYVRHMCFEIQQAIVDVLIKKTLQAAKDFHVKAIILGGGVSANQGLRKQLKESIQKEIPTTKYLIPDFALSTDNALMIAVAGYFNKAKKIGWQRLSVHPNLRIGN